MSVVSSHSPRRERRRAPAIVLLVSVFGLSVPIVAIPLIYRAVEDRFTERAEQPLARAAGPAVATDAIFVPEIGMRAPDPGSPSLDWKALRNKQADGGVTPPPTEATQSPPAEATQSPPAGATQSPPAGAGEANAQEGRRGRGQRGERGGRGGSGRWGGRGRSGGDGESSEQGAAGRMQRPEQPRPGIAVTDPLIIETCSPCHEKNDEGLMTRISYMRKSPEGWEISLKRMLRLYGVELEPDQARQMIRYLANDHGLARAEAASSMYEVERRVHWSEEKQAEDLRETCAKCHTLGRVLAERRDAKEWKLLKATHLAMFPLADFQAFRGRRSRGGGGGGRGGGGESFDWQSMTEAEMEERREQMEQRPRTDRADQVLGRLSKELPLFSEEWKAWSVNRREVPVAGRYTVIGHEVSRGDVRGEVVIRRDGPDTYQSSWDLVYGDGRRVHRDGKGILYAGYSWRGRSTTTAPGEAESLREVMLLSEDWTRFEGRIFTGGYNELGMDVTLHRHTGAPQIFAIDHGSLMIPCDGHRIDIIGSNFPEDLAVGDFHVGEGVTVTNVERKSANHVVLTANVARKTDRGTRLISMRNVRGPREVVLYDTVDYIKIFPEEGFARIGGKMRPKQNERFEAYAMNRGPDDKPYTDDDYKVQLVDAKWHVEEFPIRPDDDDAKYVGEIDPATGFFTPAIDGPNPERKFKANNIGDVYVVATVTLTVQELPKKKKEKKKKSPTVATGDREATANGGDSEGGETENQKPQSDPDAPEEATEVVDDAKEKVEADPPIRMITKEFRARGHLLVTVPVYVQWDRYEWETGR